MIKRRSTFAAPFVITVLLAPGCGGPQGNPPALDPNVDKWVDGGGGQWTFTHANGDHTWRKPDGTCELHASMGGCPKGAMCNPPPPQDVECPAGLPPEATQPDAAPTTTPP